MNETEFDKKMKRIISLVSKALDFKEIGGLNNNLAAALIFTGFAEFIAAEVLQLIEHYINLNLNESVVKINNSIYDQQANLGGRIKQLKEYDFPHKDNLVGALTIIKTERNKLFHQLILGAFSNKKIKNSSVLIRKATTDLYIAFNLISSSLIK